MSSNAFNLILFLIVADLAAAVIVTRVIQRRGYTGLRRFLLLALTWLVPGIGALCAVLAMWEFGKAASHPEPVETSFVGRSASESAVSDDPRDNHPP